MIKKSILFSFAIKIQIKILNNGHANKMYGIYSLNDTGIICKFPC